MRPQEPQKRPLRRLGQQLDLDGRPHDLEPVTERMRLFEPVEQVPGQTRLTLADTDN